MSEGTGIPKSPDGTYNLELVKDLYLASEFIDWVRFAEKQGWDPHRSRLNFPVRTWQDEKRKLISEKQTDVISALIFERKYKWTREIVDTLERYPKLIDKGSFLVEAKMQYLQELYVEYVSWKKSGNNIITLKNGKQKRVFHPWERVSLMDMSYLMKALKEVTDAKLKSLMLDKWASKRLDLPDDDLNPEPEEKEIERGITVEGGKQLTYEQMQRWFDEFADKPSEHHEIAKPAAAPIYTEKDPSSVNPNEAPKQEVVKPRSIQGLLDDNGQPVGGITIPVRNEDG